MVAQKCLGFILLWTITINSSENVPTEKQQEKIMDREYWYEQARIALRKRLQYSIESERRPFAKNVILFVGDGMGVATATAARILRGQRLGKKGEDHNLAWDSFPAVALAKTFNMDAQIGESSACATALMCGVKTNFETVGLDARGRFENCFSSFSSRVPSLIDWAQESGKSTGIVTNTRITHATPAALYGHSPSRYWEDDSKVPPTARKSCKDLARQLIENDPGRNINVLLGGGRRHWLPKVAYDPEMTKEEGRRLDGRNLIDDWVRDKKKRLLKANYVWNKGQLDQIDPREVDYLLGIVRCSPLTVQLRRNNYFPGYRFRRILDYTSKSNGVGISTRYLNQPFWFAVRSDNITCRPVSASSRFISTRYMLSVRELKASSRIELPNKIHKMNKTDLYNFDGKKKDKYLVFSDSKKYSTSYVFIQIGLFSFSHMDFEADRDPSPRGDPSLADMTRSALSILLKNPKGFLLVVEGGRIDHAHHYNNAFRALDETLAMETALLGALALVNPTETLIVVTSDHSHVLTMGGQATPRGHPILGPDSKVSDVDGQPYTTILYGNGPGYATPRIVPMNISLAAEDKNQVHGSAVPRQWATHGGEDVPVYALGPLATTLFTGTFDQSYIPHAIAYSACLGEHRLRCQGLDNYTGAPLMMHVGNCDQQQIDNVVHSGQQIVIASSVMSDDGQMRVKTSTGKKRHECVYIHFIILVAIFLGET